MLGDVAAAVAADANSLAVSLQDLKSDIITLQMYVGAAEELAPDLKSVFLADLSRIFVAVDNLTLKFAGDDDKKRGVADELKGVVTRICADAQQVKLPMGDDE